LVSNDFFFSGASKIERDVVRVGVLPDYNFARDLFLLFDVIGPSGFNMSPGY
jgi:hypothetical protein